MVNIFITKLEPNDVLLGRGTGPNANEGNKRFRILSSQLIKRSTTSSSSDDDDQEGQDNQDDDLDIANKKRILAEKLVKIVQQSRKGRFVRKLTKEESVQVAQEMYQTTDKKVLKKKMKNGGKLPDIYVVVPDQVAIEKAKQSFRHQLRRRRTSSSSQEEDVDVDVLPSSEEDLLMEMEEVDEEAKVEAAPASSSSSSTSNIDSSPATPTTPSFTASIRSEAKAAASSFSHHLVVPEDSSTAASVVGDVAQQRKVVIDADPSPVLMNRRIYQQDSSVAAATAARAAAVQVLQAQAEVAATAASSSAHIPLSRASAGINMNIYNQNRTAASAASQALQEELSFLIQLENKLRTKRLQMTQGGSLPLFPSLSSSSSASMPAAATLSRRNSILLEQLVGRTTGITGTAGASTAATTTPSSSGRIVTPTHPHTTLKKTTMTSTKMANSGGAPTTLAQPPVAPVLSPLQPPPSLLKIHHQNKNMNPIDSNLTGGQQGPATPVTKKKRNLKNPLFLARKSRPMDPSMFISHKQQAADEEEMSAVDTLSTLHLK